MPLYGSLDLDRAYGAAPVVDSLAPDSWSMPGARILQVSYEVDEAGALLLTPPALHPSIPPYATFSFIQAPQSPVGPFTLAMVRLVVRAGIRPRALLLGARTDNLDAAHGLSAGWGFSIAVADVELSWRHNRIRGTVGMGGVAALDVQLEDPDPIGPGDLELFDNLHLLSLGGERLIVQVDPGYENRSADRGPADLRAFDGERWGIEGLIPTHPLVAVAAESTITLGGPRFVMDPATPAIKGTRRLEST